MDSCKSCYGQLNDLKLSREENMCRAVTPFDWNSRRRRHLSLGGGTRQQLGLGLGYVIRSKERKRISTCSFGDATAATSAFSPKCFSSSRGSYSSSTAFLPQSLKLLPSGPLFKSSSSSSTASSSNSDFHGSRLFFPFFPKPPHLREQQSPSNPQIMSSIGIIGKAQKWWDKGLQPNMKEVKGARDLVDSLLSSGDKLVVVDFFSPGCGGCKALHPKICQLAEVNPDVQFLQVNYEEHKSMCYSLNVHVLPFFRFYRGAHGRLCSFSCTNATIKKFKDALAKYGADFCSLGPTKGLEEKELLALAANKDLSFNYTPNLLPPIVTPEQEEILTEEVAITRGADSELPLPLPRPLPLPSNTVQIMEQDPEKRTLISSGRSSG